jgi:pimeloyl-ACP methyl ester carboxylesterase
MSPTPTLIFIHGAWHSAECWLDVVSDVEKHGYRCLTPQLEFCGTAEPVNSLASSVSQIQTLIAQETGNGNDVVLINHSFGGSVGCSSVKGFSQKDPSKLTPNSGKVIGIIQLCAFMPPSNTSLYDMIDPSDTFHHSSPDGWEVIDKRNPEDLFYNDLDQESAQLWKGRLLKHSTATLKDRESIYAGWADVPVSYIFAARDQAIPIQIQEAMVAAARGAGASITTRTLDSGHSPFLSKIDETVSSILEDVETFKLGSAH